ncbi:MAG: exodeoxyribonuclease III [Alphaproteobacteria bacterium]|nr:exodeoxyribonuclease III [Alphaproteobacteria bacterium]
MKIATWNVNSIRTRLDNVTQWLKEANPDVVCLQELKCTDEQFPREPLESLGYNCAVHGQKSYNGVAILSKRPMDDVTPRLPGDDEDNHSRYMEAIIPGERGTIRIGSLYAPNGNPIGTDKFTYKLAWHARLQQRAQELLKDEEAMALMGDYNIIPEPQDCKDPKNWMKDALYQPESRAAFRTLANTGYTDAFRACNAAPHQYTFWDYFVGTLERNNGIRIDHIMLTPQAADRLKTCVIDKHVREREKPSDHVPIWAELDI